MDRTIRSAEGKNYGWIEKEPEGRGVSCEGERQKYDGTNFVVPKDNQETRELGKMKRNMEREEAGKHTGVFQK